MKVANQTARPLLLLKWNRLRAYQKIASCTLLIGLAV